MVPTRSLVHLHCMSAVSFVQRCSIFQSYGAKILLAQFPWHSQFFGSRGPQNCPYQHDHQVYRLSYGPAPASYKCASSLRLGLSVRSRPKLPRSSRKGSHLTGSCPPPIPALFANLSRRGTATATAAFWAIISLAVQFLELRSSWELVVKQSLQCCLPEALIIIATGPFRRLARRRDWSIF